MIVKSLFCWKFNFANFAADPFLFDTIWRVTVKKFYKSDTKTDIIWQIDQVKLTQLTLFLFPYFLCLWNGLMRDDQVPEKHKSCWLHKVILFSRYNVLDLTENGNSLILFDYRRKTCCPWFSTFKNLRLHRGPAFRICRKETKFLWFHLT